MESNCLNQATPVLCFFKKFFLNETKMFYSHNILHFGWLEQSVNCFPNFVKLMFFQFKSLWLVFVRLYVCLSVCFFDWRILFEFLYPNFGKYIYAISFCFCFSWETPPLYVQSLNTKYALCGAPKNTKFNCINKKNWILLVWQT
jgi:hypothetical protein